MPNRQEPENRPLKVGLCGLGTVGQGVVNLLHRNAEQIERRAGRAIQLHRVASRTPRDGVPLHGAVFDTDVFDVLSDSELDVVVELIGGESTAADLCFRALEQGFHVVTANKALIATRGNELMRLAAAMQRSIRFEAAVAGGLPILKTITQGLSADRISWIAGIINGTSNYILSAMEHQNREFDDVLTEAQQLGYAEADPSFDIGGTDAAHKLTVLAALAFNIEYQFDAVYTEGIASITPEDIEYAKQLGYRIKHLGIAHCSDRGIDLRVHPTLIPADRLLASVDGVMNAVSLYSDALGSSMYYGAGAGALPTASSVIADLVDIARDPRPVPYTSPPASKMLPMHEVESAYYLKIPAIDQPGVLARVAEILSQEGISIESVIQREQAVQLQQETAWVPVIILTQRVIEKKMNTAQSTLENLAEVVGPITRLRVETLDGHA